jgi:NADPH2:quinone reductase
VVVATAGSAEKVEVCRRLGAHHAVDYRGQDFVAAVHDVTGGRGADVIFDPVGGDVFDQSTRCVAWEGRILPIGFAGGRIPSVAVNRILLKNISVVGLFWTTYFEHAPHLIREAHARLIGLYEKGEIRPLVHHCYPMEELPQALAAVADRRCCGKAVLDIAGGTAA